MFWCGVFIGYLVMGLFVAVLFATVAGLDKSDVDELGLGIVCVWPIAFIVGVGWLANEAVRALIPWCAKKITAGIDRLGAWYERRKALPKPDKSKTSRIHFRFLRRG